MQRNSRFASIVLTFLAGAEVDPDGFRERFGASVSIGLVSFAGPFVYPSWRRGSSGATETG